jgi:flavin-binding protein dodecin
MAVGKSLSDDQSVARLTVPPFGGDDHPGSESAARGRPGAIAVTPKWEQSTHGPGVRWPKERAVSVYRVIDVIGTSQQSWEDAASVAIKTAGQSLRDLRVGEVIEQDITLGEGGGLTYRTKLRLSFKYEGGQ